MHHGHEQKSNETTSYKGATKTQICEDQKEEEKSGNIMKDDIINSLVKQYEAKIDKANTTIMIYLSNAVGIGEHPNIIDEVDKQVDIVASNEHKINIIRSFK